MVGPEIGRADVLVLRRNESTHRGEGRGGWLRVAPAIEDAAAREEVVRRVGIVIVIPIPEHLLDAVAHRKHPLALEIGGLLPFADGLAGESIPSPFGDPELAELAVARRGLLPVAPHVAQIRGLRLAHAGVEVRLGVFRAVLAAIAVTVHDVDVAEIPLLDEFLRLLYIDAGKTRRDSARIGTRRLDDVTERLAVASIAVERLEHEAIRFVIELERSQIVEGRHGERHLAAPFLVGSEARVIVACRVPLDLDRPHKAGKSLDPDILRGLNDFRIPRPAGVLAVAASAAHPVEVERIVAHPGEADAGELLVADIATTMDVDSIGRRLLFLVGQVPRM